MTQSWFGWIVKDYQKEVLDVIEKLNLRTEESNDPDNPGCLRIMVDPPKGYTNADILGEDEYQNRDTLNVDQELHHRSLSQITGSCRKEEAFGSSIWFEARRGYPSAYFGVPKPACVGHVYTIWDYCHMLARTEIWPREGIVIPDGEINEKMEKMYPGKPPGTRLCSFMGAVGMIFPEGFWKEKAK